MRTQGRRRPTRRALLSAATALLLAMLVSFLAAYQHLGRTPGELLDYAERRLEGHTRLEALARPLMAALRTALEAPSAQDRARLRFDIPPPPPRRGKDQVALPEPVPSAGKVWRVGPGGSLHTIAEAARRAQDGDVVEIEAGDYHGDVAVWEQARLTIRGVGGAARLFADGNSAEGKAIWVIRRGSFDIANIDFIGTKVVDGNGAGIRFEAGTLRLHDCLFWGNQTGLLTGNDAQAELMIDSSEFAYSHVDGHWAHNLYVGTIAKLEVRGSYFHHASVGHLLKSRARVSDVLYNRLTDERGGRASYELDFPNGGFVRVVGNFVEQSRTTENSTVIAYGEEGYRWLLNELHVASNTLVNDHPHGGTLVRVAAGSDRVVAANNLRFGPGGYRVGGALEVINDVEAASSDFVNPAAFDYRLRPEVVDRWHYEPLADERLRTVLEPRSRYVHPRRVEPLVSPVRFPGADPGG